MDARPLLPLILALALAACATPETIVETQRVEIPIPVRVQPPPELREPYRPAEIPAFVHPADPEAAAALTPAGIRQIQELLYGLTVRVREWEAWGLGDQSDE